MNKLESTIKRLKRDTLLLYFVLVGLIVLAIFTAIKLSKPDNSNDRIKSTIEITNNYKPSDFKENYKIDLKQDGYLIEDQNGEVYFVPNGQLEVWFLEMNL
jgi:hypothetical protein